MQKVVGNENEHRTQIPIHLKLMKTILLAIKENMVWPFLLGANKLILVITVPKNPVLTLVIGAYASTEHLHFPFVLGIT